MHTAFAGLSLFRHPCLDPSMELLPRFAMWFTIEILYIASHRELAHLSWALGCPHC